MKEYNKLSNLNNSDNQNVNNFFSNDQQYEDAFLPSNSPSRTKSKLETIPELPTNLIKSKSTTELSNLKLSDQQFDDDFVKIKSANDYASSNSSDQDLTNYERNLNRYDQNRINSNDYDAKERLEKSFFSNNKNEFINNKLPCKDLIKPPELHNKPAKELAVELRNISYQYGIGRKATKVLNDITLKVPLGGIYGLLGPSGCGKTSLLKIVVGLNHTELGLVRVFGQSPGLKNGFIPGPGLGYMPQDISLFSDLTVAETLVFYSKIYRMKSHLVAERIEFLLKLLALEEKGNRLIKQLSGGQKRRVSLAVALVHSPPLVILDEPTVGVDPLLRQSIWEHLVRLAKETSLTVIITTHYIEEARQANTVGLMRFGRILIESNPEKLMLKYKLSNLEDVFLKACMMDEKEFNLDENDADYENLGKSQIKFGSDAVHYSTTPKDSSIESVKEILKKYQDDIPTVVVSDLTLPISPHIVNEKENENLDQGLRYMNNSNLNNTPGNTKQNQFNKLRSPLSPLELNDNKNEKFNSYSNDDDDDDNKMKDENNYLKVIKRDRSDTSSSLGSSIIEYDSSSMQSRDSCPTPCKLAIFKQEFKNTFEPKTTFKHRVKTSVSKIAALFYKNITLLRRNIPLLLFQFFLPSFEIILFGICIGADPFNIKVAVFNQDTSGQLPQRYLNTLDNYTINQIYYPDLPSAINAVRNGETWGAIAFKQDFSVAIGNRHIYGLQSDNETLDHSNIYIFLDMTNQLIGYKLQRTFYESFQKFSKELLIEQDSNPAAIDIPVKIGKPIYGDRDPTFTEFMAPGVVLTIAFLATVALTALAFVMERKDGIMERILVSGVTPFEFLMSHVVTQLCVIVVQVALLLIFTFLVFDIPSRGPFIWVILLTMLQAICGMEYGLLISSLCESETAATMMALGSFYPNLLLSGTVWPTQAMPNFMRYFSYALPQTLPIESMRYILSRGWDPSHPEVLYGFLITIAWTIFFMIATMVAFRKI